MLLNYVLSLTSRYIVRVRVVRKETNRLDRTRTRTARMETNMFVAVCISMHNRALFRRISCRISRNFGRVKIKVGLGLFDKKASEEPRQERPRDIVILLRLNEILNTSANL